MNHDVPPAEVLTVGRLARATGASVRSLRHYDAHGLLASERLANGYRVFPPVAVARVRQIQRLLAAGFNLEEIRAFPDCMRLVEGAGACLQTLGVQRKRLAQIERQIANLEHRRARLREMLTQGPLPPQRTGSRPKA